MSPSSPYQAPDDLVFETFSTVFHAEQDGSANVLLNNLQALEPLTYPLVDCHVHAVNFIQETQGFDRLISTMDQANITKAVVFGLPVTKMWHSAEREAPEYYLDDDAPCYYYSLTDAIIAREYQKLPQESQDRIYPLVCGFNPTDKNAIKHVKRMFDLYPNVFCGIGEIFFRHDDLTLLTQGETPKINSPAMEPVIKLAIEYDFPILIHNNLSSTWTSNHPRYLYELEDTLRAYPKAKIVLCHCGASRQVSVPFYKSMLTRLLTEHEGLLIDFSWVMYDENICHNNIIDPEWFAFTEQFSDRILLGSDVIGNFHKIGVINSRFMPFLA